MDGNNDNSVKNILRQGIDTDLGLEKKVVSLANSLAKKLNKEIEKGNDTSAFMIALLLAAFKDFMDIVLAVLLVGEIPGVNFLVGLFLTTFLFFFMLGKGWFLKWKIKFWFWVLGLIVDGLPVIGVLPMNVLLVLYAWRLARKRKKRAEAKMEQLPQMTTLQINELEADISLLESTEYVEGFEKTPNRKRQEIDTEATRNKTQNRTKPKGFHGGVTLTNKFAGMSPAGAPAGSGPVDISRGAQERRNLESSLKNSNIIDVSKGVQEKRNLEKSLRNNEYTDVSKGVQERKNLEKSLRNNNYIDISLKAQEGRVLDSLSRKEQETNKIINNSGNSAAGRDFDSLNPKYGNNKKAA
jgi:hypothetical protein